MVIDNLPSGKLTSFAVACPDADPIPLAGSTCGSSNTSEVPRCLSRRDRKLCESAPTEGRASILSNMRRLCARRRCARRRCQASQKNPNRSFLTLLPLHLTILEQNSVDPLWTLITLPKAVIREIANDQSSCALECLGITYYPPHLLVRNLTFQRIARRLFSQSVPLTPINRPCLNVVPDLVGGKVPVPVTFTTRVAIHCGPCAITPATCVYLLDGGCLHTFIRESM